MIFNARKLLSSITLLLLFTACKKFEKKGTLPESGVALTFDDNYIDNWYKYLPLFDSLHVKATFYISGYHKCTPSQINKLRIMKEHGHEIGYHTTNHVNVPKYINKYGIEKFYKNEILQDLAKMKNDGFRPTVFAYPYGAHNESTNNIIKQWFSSIRALNGTPDFSKSLTRSNNETLLYGMGIDANCGKKDDFFDRFLLSANKNKNCAVLVAHKIEEANTNQKVPLKRLINIIEKAKALNMQFYTVSEISRK